MVKKPQPDGGNPIGLCCAGSSCEPSDEGSCNAVGGNWTPPPDDGDSCSCEEIIRSYINGELGGEPLVALLAGGTYSLMRAARDEIVRKSKLSHVLLPFLDQKHPDLVRLMQANPDLRRQLLLTLLRFAALTRIMLRYIQDRDSNPRGEGRYTRPLHNELLSLSSSLEAAGVSSYVINTLKSFLKEAEPLIDLPLPRLLETIGVGAQDRKQR